MSKKETEVMVELTLQKPYKYAFEGHNVRTLGAGKHVVTLRCAELAKEAECGDFAKIVVKPKDKKKVENKIKTEIEKKVETKAEKKVK